MGDCDCYQQQYFIGKQHLDYSLKPPCDQTTNILGCGCCRRPSSSLLMDTEVETLKSLVYNNKSVHKLFVMSTVPFENIYTQYNQGDYKKTVHSLAKVLHFVLQVMLKTQIDTKVPKKKIQYEDDITSESSTQRDQKQPKSVMSTKTKSQYQSDEKTVNVQLTQSFLAPPQNLFVSQTSLCGTRQDKPSFYDLLSSCFDSKKSTQSQATVNKDIPKHGVKWTLPNNNTDSLQDTSKIQTSLTDMSGSKLTHPEQVWLARSRRDIQAQKFSISPNPNVYEYLWPTQFLGKKEPKRETRRYTYQEQTDKQSPTPQNIHIENQSEPNSKRDPIFKPKAKRISNHAIEEYMPLQKSRQTSCRKPSNDLIHDRSTDLLPQPYQQNDWNLKGIGQQKLQKQNTSECLSQKGLHVRKPCKCNHKHANPWDEPKPVKYIEFIQRKRRISPISPQRNYDIITNV